MSNAPDQGCRYPTSPVLHASRPTCRTCVYFQLLPSYPEGVQYYQDCGNEQYIPIPATGRCRRRSPRPGGFAHVMLDDWCGDHPDFKDWWDGLHEGGQ